MQGTAYVVAMIPAFSLRFRELAVANGLDEAATAASLGKLTAMRSLVEFGATPTLAFWSDRIGRRPVMLLCALALCFEFGVLASSQSLWVFSATYIAFGLLANANGALESTCIADATPPGAARAVAFSRFFTVVGAVMVVGPVIGGHLAAIDGRAPFAAASILYLISLFYMFLQLPEYYSKRDPNSSNSRASSSSVVKHLLMTSPSTLWYIGASVFSSMGVGAFGSVQVLWLRSAFGWDGQQVGKFISLSGLLVIVSQSVILPRLLQRLKGCEPLVAQMGLMITAAKLVAYGLAPSGLWLYAFQLSGVACTCAIAPLRSLCTKAVPESHQGAVTGIISALSTAAQVIGSIVGSQVFATSLRMGFHVGSALFVAAACYCLAFACVVHAAHVEKAVHPKRMEVPEWASGA
jgi:DHA1 family tetracycline resistance protein-like MFS transporter